MEKNIYVIFQIAQILVQIYICIYFFHLTSFEAFTLRLVRLPSRLSERITP